MAKFNAKVYGLARHLECSTLRAVDTTHRHRQDVMYTSDGDGKSPKYIRSSIIFEVFKRQLKKEIDTEEKLLQVLKDDLSKMDGDVQLSDEMKEVFHLLYDALKDLKECTDEHDAALSALAGSADYLPCHPLAAAEFVLKFIPTFFIKGEAQHLEKDMLALITSSGFQTSTQLLARYFDKSRMTYKQGYVSDLFRIVFTLYYWPYANIESFHSLSVRPDYSTSLTRRSNCRDIMQTHIPATLLGRVGIRECRLRPQDEFKIFRDHYMPHLQARNGTFYLKVNEQDEAAAELYLRESVFKASQNLIVRTSNQYEIMCQGDSEGVGGTYQSTTPASMQNVSEKAIRILFRMYGAPRLGSNFVFADIGCAQNRPAWFASLYGFRAIGIEIDDLRSAAARYTALDIMNGAFAKNSQVVESRFAKNSKVAFIQADVEKPLSLVGIHSFLVWNEAFTFDLTSAIIKNIANSLDHPSLEGKQRKGRLPKALIIIGMKRMRRVLELFDERFCYKEVGHVDITLRVIGTTNRLKFFEVELRSDYVPTILDDASVVVLDRAKPFFKNSTTRKREYEKVIKSMEPGSDSGGMMTRSAKAKKQ